MALTGTQKVDRFRRRRKAFLVKYKGGCCARCGYKKCLDALVFHHRDPKQKSFGIAQSSRLQQTLEKLLVEVDKCDLLCANCHAESHSKAEAEALEAQTQ